ncbi:MAG: hypothetical protein HQL87_04100 [Magnetococcales bacterium]|nr:hypothetical protein [Magnetococcales bacterium]
MRIFSPHKRGGLIVLLCLFALLLSPSVAHAVVWYAGEFSADIIITDPRTPDSAVRGTFYVGKDRFRTEGIQQGQPAAMIVQPQDRLVWTLFPEDKTYYAGPGSLPVPPRPDVEQLPGDADGPCQQDKAIVCTRLGTETRHNVATEKWEIQIPPPSPPSGKPDAADERKQTMQKVLLWVDPVRHIVIRQQLEQGPGMERLLVATENKAGRVTEKWDITQTFQDQTQHTFRWVDSKLRLPIREEAAGKVIMELVNLHEGVQAAERFAVPNDFKEIQQ